MDQDDNDRRPLGVESPGGPALAAGGHGEVTGARGDPGGAAGARGRRPPDPRAAEQHIDRVVEPAAAVLKVFDAVHGLELPLLAGGAASGELPGYLAVLGRLGEVLRFLSDNCGLAAQWLADIVEYLGDRSLADPRFLADLGVTLDELKNPSGDLDGGLLAAALDMLEAEYRRILADHSAPLAMQQLITTSASIAPSPIPPPLSTISA